MKLSQVATISAELIDILESDFADVDEENLEVGVIAVVVEINQKRENGEFTGIHYRCSDARRWVQHGFFQGAARASLYDYDSDGEDEDEQ